jgi:hypothetical protein
MTLVRFRHVLMLLAPVTLLLPMWAATAQPSLGPRLANTQIPAQPTEAALDRGAEAARRYAAAYGPLQIEVVVASVDGQSHRVVDPSPVARAVAAEVEAQLAEYTGGAVLLSARVLEPDRAARIAARQNGDTPASEVFLREVRDLAGAPYVLAMEVGPDTNGVKPAGPVTLRLIEVATGRVLTTVSDQFWQDAERYPHVPEAAWVQHSVTYWMEELMGRRGLPRALAGPYLLTLQLVGEVPDAAMGPLKRRLAERFGLPTTAVNPRRSRDAFDVVTLNLMLPDPPQVAGDGLAEVVDEVFAEAGLTAEPMRRDGGDFVFAVGRTPAWWTLTGGDTAAPAWGAWDKLLENAGGPAVAVLSYTDPSAGASSAYPKVFAGQGRALAQAVESRLLAAGLEVVGVEPVEAPYAGAGSGTPPHLAERARWVCYLETTPGGGLASPTAVARLVDLQADRVLGAAVFPAAAAAVPAGQPAPDPLAHAARYLVGSLMADALTHPRDYRQLRLVVEQCPSFEFAQRVGNIALAQPGVADVVLPTFDRAGRYSLEVRYQGSPAGFTERLRADLSTLPLSVGEFAEGRLVLRHETP